MTFEQFFTDLKSDEVWFTNATMHYKPETVNQVAKDLFMSCSADGSLNRPAGDMRRYFWNKLKKITPDKVSKQWVPKEEPKEQGEIVLGKAREAWIKAWEQAVKQSPIFKSTPKLTSQMIEEEGGVRPKRVQPYPATSLTEFEKHQRHLEYLKYAYDPRTGDRIPGTVDESEYNKLYES